MGPAVDVAMSVYGKPYQTAVTLASLLRHSGHHVGTVWFLEELEQPFSADVSALPTFFPDHDVRSSRPAYHVGIAQTSRDEFRNEEVRQSIRYQFAWEKTEKDYLFITHNDCVYSSDIIGGMLERLQDGSFSGVGMVGQCWNCPAKTAGKCDGDRQEYYRPTYEEAADIVSSYPSPRTQIEQLNRVQPAPFPECRLNEFGCLISLRKCRGETVPHGDVDPFGNYELDLGTAWFHTLVRRGHRFLNWYDGMSHSPFSGGAGHPLNSDFERYTAAETLARDYLGEHFPDLLTRLDDSQRRNSTSPDAGCG